MKQVFKSLFALLLVFAMTQSSFAQQDVNGWYWLNGRPAGQTLRWVKVFDAANIFAVGGRGIFMKSSDGGDSWSIAQAGAADISSAGLAERDLFTGWFFNANTGIVAGATQTGSPLKTVIQKTNDGGVTWTTKIVNNTAGGSVNGIYFINSTTGYLCGGNNARLYKTTDQGETWTNISTIPAFTYYSMHAFDENNLIVTSDSRRIMRTTDAGTTWKTDTIFTAATNVQFLGIKFKDANTGYVIGNPNYFAYTTNAGVNWTASTHSSIRGQRSIEYDNNTVWTAGDYEYVYKSTNDGVTWDSVKFYDLSNVNQPAPFIIYGLGANGNDLAVVGNNGQTTLSNDGGATWRNKNYSVDPVNTAYASIYAESATGRVWVGSNFSGISNLLYSTNGGANWTTQPNGMSDAVRGIDFPSANVGYLGGGRATSGIGQMAKSTDAGLTWTALPLVPPLSTYQINSIDFINDNTGWAGGFAGAFAPHLLMKTTDGGLTWTQQVLETNPNGAVISVQMVDENNGYVLANSGGAIYTTTNSGTNWVKTTNSFVLTTSWSNMVVLNKDVIFLHGGGTSGAKYIARSMDGGNTWTDIGTSMVNKSTIFRSKWLNPNHGVISGASGWMARTTDGGVTWAESNPGFSTTVDVSYPEKNAWFTVSDRNGAYQIGRKLETSTSISVNLNVGIEGFWNGTSQVSDTVTVELRNSTSPYALVDQGKTVLTPGVGYGSVDFNTAGSGSYYIVVKHRNALQTWSAAPVAMTAGGNHNYDFTSALTQAYGSNMVLKLGRICFFSGDVNQDEVVDGSDLSLIDNDGFNFVSGYVATDCNGDNFTDASDAAIADNNAFNTVAVAKP
jgi:photosystem II stability/assembly factor-like uncharacterized protein